MTATAGILAQPSMRALLAGAIDYAGLFPPSSLDLTTVIANYQAYRAGPDAWSLGRLVVPAARLPELADAATPSVREERAAGIRDPWRISALVSKDAAAEVAHIMTFNQRCAAAMGGHAVVDSVETKAASVADVRASRGRFDAMLHFVEIPVHGTIGEVEALVDAIRDIGASAKIRMGGVTPDAFPAAREVARFLRVCADAGVSFKATAGLHHPLRGAHRLTYAPDSPVATMYGYLNLFLAAARARAGASEDEVQRVLEATTDRLPQVTHDAVYWHGAGGDAASIAATRASFALSFGSCSFREPLDDLSTLFPT